MRTLRHLRRRSGPTIRKQLTVALTDVPGLPNLPGTAAAADAALALIARLPRDQPEAVLLRVVVGLDVATAAEVLSKRPAAVRSAADRGLRKLAEYLDKSI